MRDCGLCINLDKIRDTIKLLALNANISIQQLRRDPNLEHLCSRYDELTATIARIKDSDAYDAIFNIVDEETRSLTRVVPGTIGAYFRGCLLPVNFPDYASCSEICINGMQPPDRPGFFSCDKTVIKCVRNKDGFQIIPVNIASGPGYLLVEHTTLDGFIGFSNEEKAEIQQYGLTMCKLLSMSTTQSDYRDLLGGFVSIESLPSRVENSDSKPSEINGVGIAIFILGFGLTIIFLTWWLKAKKQ